MQRGRLLMAGLIAGAVVLTATVYLLPKTQPAKTAVAEGGISGEGFDFEGYKERATRQLSEDLTGKLKSIEKANNASGGNFRELGTLWDSAGNPGIAAWYFEKLAEQEQTDSSYLNAAYRYFDAFKAGKDSSEAAWFSSKAISNYQKVLELNPGNLNAKTDLGALYAEATNEPMKGIMLLREVVAADSTHENAQLNLGFLSMRSGQFEKAIERFEKVLAINPARIDMYIYRGEALVQMGKTKEAIESFKIFRNLTNDQELAANVDKYIESLEHPDPMQMKKN